MSYSKMSNIMLNMVNGIHQEPDLPTPEEEFISCFHSPKHYRVGSFHSFVASQDSIDTYHDALSTLSFPQRIIPSLATIVQSPARKCQKRRRHFSSGAKFEDEKISGKNSETALDWDEAGEQTCMLPKGPSVRVRHNSQGRTQTSKSCDGSPFHIPRLSFSANSLKQKPIDAINAAPPRNMEGASTKNFAPHAEVEMIQESDEGERIKQDLESTNLESITRESVTRKSSTLGSRDMNPEDPTALRGGCFHESTSNGDGSSWRRNYVPCVGLESMAPQNVRQQLETRTQINTNKFLETKSARGKKRFWKQIKEEFKLSNFNFNHKSPHLFVTSQWQQPKEMCCMYLAYRLFWAVYFTMWAIWSWIGFAGYKSPTCLKAYYLIYLTSWAIWLLAFDTMFRALNVIRHTKRLSVKDSRYDRMNTSLKFSWALSTVTSTLNIFVPLVFWTAIWPHKEYVFSAITANTLIVPGLYVVIDCFVSATPRRIFHAYLPMVSLTLYGVFSDIYYLAGGINEVGDDILYPIIDWGQPSKTLLIGSGLVLVVIPAIHILGVCLLSALRVRLWRNVSYSKLNNQLETNHSISMEEKV